MRSFIITYLSDILAFLRGFNRWLFLRTLLDSDRCFTLHQNSHSFVATDDEFLSDSFLEFLPWP